MRRQLLVPSIHLLMSLDELTAFFGRDKNNTVNICNQTESSQQSFRTSMIYHTHIILLLDWLLQSGTSWSRELASLFSLTPRLRFPRNASSSRGGGSAHATSACSKPFTTCVEPLQCSVASGASIAIRRKCFRRRCGRSGVQFSVTESDSANWTEDGTAIRSMPAAPAPFGIISSESVNRATASTKSGRAGLSVVLLSRPSLTFTAVTQTPPVVDPHIDIGTADLRFLNRRFLAGCPAEFGCTAAPGTSRQRSDCLRSGRGDESSKATAKSSARLSTLTLSGSTCRFWKPSTIPLSIVR